ncbi:MAG TPA: FtsX-like permease family protein [Candidatus Limnocylindrales bacterium]
MFALALSTFRQRWPLFAGAIVTVCLGVAMVQSSLLTLITAAVTRGESYEAAISLLGLIVGLSVFLAIFIVASTFAFTVAQRRRELALLRLAGGGRGQLRALLLGEATLLSLVGTAAGIIAGIPLMRFEGWLLDTLGFVPPGFTGQWRGWIVFVSGGTGIGIALLGVLAASGRASRIRPLEALRDTGRAARVMNVSRWLLGLLFLGGGIAMVILIPAVGGEGALAMSILVSFVMVLSFTAFAPLLVPLAGALLSLPARHTAIGHLVRANLRTAKRRGASTAAPIIVLVALVAAIGGSLETTAEAARQEASRMLTADLIVQSDKEIGDQLRAVPGVRVVSREVPVSFQLALSEEDTSPVDGLAIDPAAYLATHRLTPSAGELAGLTGATIALSPGFFPERSWRVGDTVAADIAGNRVELRVVALLPSSLSGPSAFVPADLVPPNEAQPRQYALKGDADAATLATLGVVHSKDDWVRDLDREQRTMNLKVMVALLGLATIYALIAIVNAVVISTAERRREFHTHRVAGLTEGQVIRMALAESLFVTSAGVLIGGLAATFTLIGNMVSIEGILGFAVLSVPVPLLILLVTGIAVLVGGASVVATRVVSQRARPTPTEF